MKLISLGFNIGLADGVLGPKTKRAIVEFEKKSGLLLTAYISDEIVELLKS
jgi:peptidoglycan hydrolase-like protein with peptidoglycan-binding domain